MYCLYVGFDYIYIDLNALVNGIKSVLASQVWFQTVAGARSYGTDSPAITANHVDHSATETCLYVCVCVYVHAYMYVYIYECIYVCMYE